MADLLDQAHIDAALGGLDPAWTGGPVQLERTVEFADFLTAVRFVDEIAPSCEERNHQPDLTINWRTVGIVLTTHDAGGVTDADVGLAGEIDRVTATLPLAT